jgi:hypothetical protein
MVCLPISALQHVFHLPYQVFDGISICNTCKNDRYMTSHREICDIVNRS